MRTTGLPLLALVLFIDACSGSPAAPVASGSTAAAEPAREPTTAQPPREPAPEAPTFVSGGVRCLHVAPEGELLSCEEISQAGADQPSAQENCAMLSGRLEPGECPTANVVGRCLAMDGPDLEPVYPIRIHHYRSSLIETAERSRELCDELSGTFVAVR